MKRVIKFRGKCLDNGKWMYGDLIENQGRFFIYHASSEKTLNDDESGKITITATEVDPDTVGQYTGLKDRNGVEIYEGDIVLHFSNKDAEVEYAFVENTSGIDPKHLHYYAVLWNNIEGGFGYVLLKEIGMRNPDMSGVNPNLGFLSGNIYDKTEQVKRL